MTKPADERKPQNEVIADVLREQADQIRNMTCHPSHQSGLEVAADHLEHEANMRMIAKQRRKS
jgi:hypothetical protein